MVITSNASERAIYRFARAVRRVDVPHVVAFLRVNRINVDPTSRRVHVRPKTARVSPQNLGLANRFAAINTQDGVDRKFAGCKQAIPSVRDGRRPPARPVGLDLVRVCASGLALPAPFYVRSHPHTPQEKLRFARGFLGAGFIFEGSKKRPPTNHVR